MPPAAKPKAPKPAAEPARARKRKATPEKAAPRDKAACKKCRPRPRGEAFYYMRERYVFDVDLAREICADGREPVEIDERSVARCIETCDVDFGHVPHVDPTIPGIVAHVWSPEETGELIHGHRLIDGHHRAARCLQDGLPYFAYILTEEESRRVMMRSPLDPPKADGARSDEPATAEA